MVESTLKSSQTVEQAIESATQQFQVMGQPEKTLKDIYLISGLGADERVFRLLKFKGYQPVHIRWLEPERGESIECYAKRLTAQISSTRPIIIGLSFGGIIAVEIAKQLEVEKLILISSAKNKFEIPPYFKMLQWFPIQRVFPFKSLLWMGYWPAYWFFSLETIDERQLLKAILLDTDARFIKWATHKVVTWKNETVPENLHHIHGLSDRIFSIRFVRPDSLIEKAGHFMIMSRAAQISALLEKIIG